MPSILNSDDGVVSGTSGLKTTGGNDGALNIQSNGSTVVAVTGSGISVTGTVSQTGVSTFAAGTVSAPSITFTGDTNTGIFSPAADTIAFTEGGTEAMRITSAGNLDIGGSAYARRLSVKDATNTVVVIEGSNAGSSNINFADGDSENPGSINYGHATNYMAFQTAGSERMRIDSSGNVGIGTSSPNSNSSRTTLTVSSASSGGGEIDLTVSGTTALRIITDGSYNTEFRNPQNAPLIFGTNNTERMRINAGAPILCLSGGNTSATGTGIAFPATQSASSDANTLDDYEEGTWTPSLGGNTTYNDRSGTYTKIGRLVYVSGIVSVNSIGTGSTSIISGLPFQSTSGFSAGAVTYYSGISSSAYNNPIPALESTTATTFGFGWNTAGATTVSQFRTGIFQNSARIDFGFVYIAS